MAPKPLQFRLNGAEKAVFVEDGQNLLDVLRRGVGDLTPKFGCGQGTCGTCTVLVDGEPQLSCLDARRDRRRARRSPPPPASPAAPRCTRCRRRSWTVSPPSAATARPAC